MTMPPDAGSGAVDEAVHRLQQGDAAGAVALLTDAVQLDPNDGRAFQYLGIARTQLGDPAGGIDALREAARLLPSSTGILYNLGIALSRAQQTDEARAVLEKALVLEPDNAKARAALDNLAPPAPASPGGGIVPPPADLGPVASAPAPPPTTPHTAAPGLGSIGGGGLAGVGGVGASPAPATAPQPVLGAPAPGMFPGAGGGVAQSDAAAAGGLAYVPAAGVDPHMFSREPTTGERILRGLGWGALCAQWWTLLVFIWQILIYGLLPGKLDAVTAVVMTILFVIVFGFVGSLAGLIIAAINGDENTGAVVGVVFGLLFLGLEFLMTRNPRILINALFWFFSGRYVGASIGKKVQALVAK